MIRLHQLYKNTLRIFRKIQPMTENDLMEYIKAVMLNKLKKKYTATETYLYREGKNKNKLYISHIDTVSDKPAPLLETAHFINAAPNSILGADDRIGVAMLLSMLHFHDISVLFTCGEEVGGIGATDFADDFKNKPLPYKLLVEFDRRGVYEYVSYNHLPIDVEEYLAELDPNIKKGNGSFSDIEILTSYLNIPSVNVACGYYNEHTHSEYVDKAALWWACRMFDQLTSHTFMGVAGYKDVSRYITTPYSDYEYINLKGGNL